MTLKLFISYSSEDSKKKNFLKNAIKKLKGLSPIVVEDYRLNGIEFTDKVKNDLKSADYFIPIITSNSYKKSQWLNQEIGFAFAILSRDKIYPIVQKNIISKLKGFIHDKAEIPYNYASFNNNPKKEMEGFRKSSRILLSDILKKEKLDSATGLKFESIVKTDYNDSEQNINREINSNLKLHLRIKLSNEKLKYRFYYKVRTDKGETIWIGYTNAPLSENGYITSNENTQNYSEISNNEISIIDTVYNTVNNRFEMMKSMGFKILGKPKSITSLRFRGDRYSNDTIHYHFAFEPEK
jgi:hypothetical protein